MTVGKDAAQVVAGELSSRKPGERGKFLREMLVHCAAGLVIIEGESEASEAVYRLADAVVSRTLRTEGPKS